ncbi:MAG: hypothetical protein K2L68_07870, partial [Muribaculaceae bacterium]|nr:hypothetical protein [Muribaculaceae bacterium]
IILTTLAINGYVSASTETEQTELSSVQLATLDALTDNESVVKIPCRTYYGKTCSFSAINSEGQYGTVVLTDQERVD